ncbi:MAG: hypothetical protein II364_04365 [Bacteroidales bacterium]|jgi:hypothetical protein|nr:hypothetical protein [Bacteroidales bacterium]
MRKNSQFSEHYVAPELKQVQTDLSSSVLANSIDGASSIENYTEVTVSWDE